MTTKNDGSDSAKIDTILVHMSYIRDDISEMRSNIKGLTTTKEHEALKTRVEKLEMTVEKVKNKIVSTAITLFMGLVLALYGLDKYFRG